MPIVHNVDTSIIYRTRTPGMLQNDDVIFWIRDDAVDNSVTNGDTCKLLYEAMDTSNNPLNFGEAGPTVSQNAASEAVDHGSKLGCQTTWSDGVTAGDECTSGDDQIRLYGAPDSDNERFESGKGAGDQVQWYPKLGDANYNDDGTYHMCLRRLVPGSDAAFA